MESDITNGVENRADSKRRSSEGFYQHERWMVKNIFIRYSGEMHIYVEKDFLVD